MKKTLIFLTLILLSIIPSAYAAQDFAFNRLYQGSQPIDGFNYSINVNSSANWITDIGSLSTVNATQFSNNGGVLNLIESWVSSRWCDLTGCTMQGDINMDANDIINVGVINFSNGYIQNPNYIQFNTSWEDGSAEGRLQWNIEDGALEFGMPGGDVNLQIGQEMLARVKNDEGETIYNCQAVFVSGAIGSNILVQTPIASNPLEAPLTVALATETIDYPNLGYVTTTGVVRDCDTSAWNAGDVLYLSATEEGNLTNIRPTAPNTSVVIGIVIRSNTNNGSIAVHPIVQQRLTFLSDVYPAGLTEASIVRYNLTNSRFEISTSYTTDEVDELIGGVNINFLFHNSSSGISTYWDMNTTDSRPKNSTTTTITTDEQELGGFISPNASELGITTMAAGLAEAHFHANVNSISGVKLISGFFRFYIRQSNGTEVFISTSELVPIRITTETEFEAHAIIAEDISMNESDRILVKLFSNFSGGGGGNPTLTTYIEGDTASRIEISTTGVNFLTKGEADTTYFRLDGTSAMQGNANIGGFNLTNVSNGFFDFLGSIGNRISKLWVDEINASGNIITEGNVTTEDSFVWGGGYITSNATCSYLRYNATGTLKESECP